MCFYIAFILFFNFSMNFFWKTRVQTRAWILPYFFLFIALKRCNIFVGEKMKAFCPSPIHNVHFSPIFHVGNKTIL